MFQIFLPPKLLIALVFAMLTPLGVGVWLYKTSYSTALLDLFQAKWSMSLETTSQKIGMAIEQDRQDVVLSELKQIQQYADVQFLAVYHRNGKAMYTYNPKSLVFENLPTLPPSSSHQMLLKRIDEQDIFLLEYPIFDQRLKTGSIVAAVSYHSVSLQVDHHTIMILTVGILLCLVSLIFVIFAGNHQHISLNKIKQLTDNFIKTHEIQNLDQMVSHEIKPLYESVQNLLNEVQKNTVNRTYMDNILNTMQDAFVVLDNKGLIKSVNQATLHLLGYESSDLINRHVSVLFAEDEKAVNQEFEKLLLKGNVSQVETMYITKSGKKIPVRYSGSVTKDPQGNAQGIISFAHDDTELKQTQAQLVQAGKLAGLGTLSTGIAHELNNPLTVVCGFADLMKEKLEKGSSLEDILPCIEKIRLASKRMTRVIDHLREFAREQRFSDYSLLSIHKVMNDSLIFLEQQIKNKNIKLLIDIDEHIPKILGNATRLETVFLNLFSNAIDSFENIKRDTKEIRVSARQIENRVILRMTDNGCGISLESRDRIFDPFFTTKEPGKGTGLGLSLAYGIIKEHSGSIECESKEGIGSTFILTLPLDRRKEFIQF